ncbi:uncharacterized protein LOC119831412 [Zerene cesonia]|uniref:uncharacterized protein LOC119831412 n=1 Tax=Zerene cesonia TaxID=33412 RepID=UPI0018E56B72|nr:uncharacterized protein LOC119831412 [Zerene cesonia]
MLSAAVAALACLCLARSSPAEPHSLRAYALAADTPKELTSILANIDERLRMLDTISAVQVKQARRLDVIQDKLDRMETTLSLRLERVQLAAERLEHRLHMLQTSVQASIKENSEKIERSQTKIAEIAQNITNQISSHTHYLEKVSGAYADTWRRSLLLESLMRDCMALVNVTRRELADGLRALARRQRDARLNSADLEAAFTKRLNDKTVKIDLKMEEVLNAQKRFVDSCQRVQLDDPTHVADVLDKLIDSLINKTASTFHELQNIQTTMRNHDTKVMKLLNNRPIQTDATCKRLESVFRNSSQTPFNVKELQQLTEKFIGLTNRADAALQRLEARITDNTEEQAPTSYVTAAADRLLKKLQGRSEKDSEENDDWGEDEQDASYFDENMDDFMDEDQDILNTSVEITKPKTTTESAVTRPPHRRHLHKHPYDRGPTWKNTEP